jgi:hypothetical protein
VCVCVCGRAQQAYAYLVQVVNNFKFFYFGIEKLDTAGLSITVCAAFVVVLELRRRQRHTFAITRSSRF